MQIDAYLESLKHFTHEHDLVMSHQPTYCDIVIGPI